MNTTTKNQGTLPPEIFALLERKAKSAEISIVDYINNFILGEQKFKQKESAWKKWQQSLPISKNRPNKETIQAMNDAKKGKSKHIKILRNSNLM